MCNTIRIFGWPPQRRRLCHYGGHAHGTGPGAAMHAATCPSGFSLGRTYADPDTITEFYDARSPILKMTIPATALAVLAHLAKDYGKPFILSCIGFQQAMDRQQPESGHT